MRTTVRWVLRAIGLVVGVVLVAACDPAPHTDLVVTTTLDGRDAVPGDGVCEITVGAGDCSLRAAVDEVNAGTPHPPVITLAPGTYALGAGAGEDANATGDLDLTASVSIVGAGATIDPGAADRAIHVRGGSLDLQQVTIAHGQAPTGGAVRVDGGGSAVVRSSTFADNVATGAYTCVSSYVATLCDGEGGGGAIWADGALVVDASTFVDNRATGGAPCITLPPPPFTPTVRCSFGDGGAVATPGVGPDPAADAVVRNSTFARNSVVLGSGGAVRGVRVTASTFVDNGTGSGAAGTASSSSLAASALTGAGPLCAAVDSQGGNVASDDTCDPQSSDQAGTDPLLGPLADHGGPTRTFLPYANSPLVDAIAAGTPGQCDLATAVDQRGVARPAGTGCDVGSVEGAGALTAAGVSLVVDDAADGSDAAPGDRVCATAAGRCTLRAAIDEANAWNRFPSTIEIADGVDPVLSVAGSGDDANASGDLDIRTGLTIVGGGAVVDAAGLDRAFQVLPAVAAPYGVPPVRVSVRLEDLTITGGAAVTGAGLASTGDVDLTLRSVTLDGNVATSTGGALTTGAGTVTVDRSTFVGNRARQGGAITQTGGSVVVRDTRFAGNLASDGASPARGGAIDQTAGTLVVDRSLFDGNQATSAPGVPTGGAIAQQNAATATITNATFAANRAVGTYFSSGGAIASSGTIDVRLSTVTGGSAASGVGLARLTYTPGPFTITGTVIDTPGNDCQGGVATGGYNVSSDSSCALLTGPGDLQSTAAQLGGLADNGGPTATQLPAPTSPLVDRVPFAASVACNGSIPTDQRGWSRPQGLACDSGAVERPGAPVGPLSLVVDDPGDAVDLAPGDGVCDRGDGRCTLRAAIGEANARPTDDAIAIAPGIDPTLSIPGAGEDAAATGDLDITDEVTIDGDGATLDAAGLDRALHVKAATTITDLTVAGGRLTPAGSTGGGILHTAGTLALVDVRVVGNVLTGTGSRGAGLASEAGTLTVTGSTFDGNAATAPGSTGGAISSAAPLQLRRSTVTGNAAENGSAIDVVGTAHADVVAVSLSRNTSRSLRTAAGASTMTVAGSAIEAFGDACSSAGPVLSGGYNVVDGTSCGFAATGDRQGTDPALAPLADHGGATPTQLPFAGSPVLDAIPAGTAGLCDASSPTDQRGVARPQGGACDVGAVEGAGTAGMTPVELVVDDAGDAGDAEPGDGTCATAAATCTLRAAIDEANRLPAADVVRIAAGVDPVLAVGGPLEEANRTGDLDVLDPLVIDGDGAGVDGAGLDRVLDVRDVAVTVRDLRVVGGAPPAEPGYGSRTGLGAGGGLRATASVVTVDGVTFEGDVADDGGALFLDAWSSATVVDSTFTANSARYLGGAIAGDELSVARSTFTANAAAQGGGALEVSRFSITASTFDRNRSDGQGGAVLADAASTGGTIVASTFVANVAALNGGAVMGGYQDPATLITSSTFTANAAPSGSTIASPNAGTVLIQGSVLDNPGDECQSPGTSQGYNVVADTTCGTTTGDRTGVAALLGPLADNGGPTATQLPYANSPAVGAIPTGTAGLCVATTPADQRGVTRPQGAACDAGAVEGSAPGPAVPLSLVVGSAADAVDAQPGDGVCATAAGVCTLRAAVDEANRWPTADVVSIAPGVNPVLGLPGREDLNATGDLDVGQPLTIHGGGATVTVTAPDRAFDVATTTLALDGLTITGGRGERGGALEATSSTVTLLRVRVEGNRGGPGGGLYAESSTVGVVESTFASNVATGDGGGIDALGSRLTVDRSTFSGNRTDYAGGGIRTAPDPTGQVLSNLTVTRSTFSQNVAGSAGGGVAAAASTGSLSLVTAVGNTAPQASAVHTTTYLFVRGSILAGPSGTVCAGGLISLGYNLVSGGPCPLSAATGDVVVADPLLGALAANGGPTSTHLPAIGSAVLDAIPPGTAGLCDASVATDQRGSARPVNGACDRGAVER